MSFASDVKSEMIRAASDEKCCLQAELNALIKFGGSIIDGRLDLSFNSASIARRTLMLIKKFFPDVKTGIAVLQLKPLRRRKRYIIRIFQTAAAEALPIIFYDVEFPESDCCRKAFLRGMFLARGTLNRPETSYHFELVTLDPALANFAVEVMNEMDFPARTFVRGGKFIVYLKDFESIADLLALLGANDAVDRCEAARNVKEVRSLANRIVNCETSNLQLAVNAAQRQIEDIKFIIKKGVKLTPELNETARARLKHPEMPMSELAQLLYVTTGGLKHRMRRLRLLAAQAR